MKNSCTIFLIFIASFGFAQSGKLAQPKSSNEDWLVSPFEQKATITNEGQNIVLNNGLVKRSFVIASNVACFDYTNLTNGQQLIRSVEPEAKVVIDQITYKVGGLSGQKEKAYLQIDQIKNLQKADSDFIFQNIRLVKLNPLLNGIRLPGLAMQNNQQVLVLNFNTFHPLQHLKILLLKCIMKYMMAYP